jgi:hypothetical protein
VLGIHAYPHTAAVHPRGVLPPWTFSSHEEEYRPHDQPGAPARGVSLVVLLSQKRYRFRPASLLRACRASTIILCAHGDDALPAPVKIGKTLLVAFGKPRQIRLPASTSTCARKDCAISATG